MPEEGSPQVVHMEQMPGSVTVTNDILSITSVNKNVMQ